MDNTNSLFNNIIDCYLLINEDNRQYFSGLRTSFGGVILNKKAKYYITDFRYEYAAKEALNGWELKFVKYSEFYDTVKAILHSLGAKTVGFEDQSLTYSEFQNLKEALNGFELIPCSDIVDTCRMVKSEEEIKLIKISQEITEKALCATLERIKPKMSERDVCAEIIYNMYLNGADGLSFEPIVAMGVNTYKPHHSYSDYRLDKDDFITLDPIYNIFADFFSSEYLEISCELSFLTPQHVIQYITEKEKINMEKLMSLFLIKKSHQKADIYRRELLSEK